MIFNQNNKIESCASTDASKPMLQSAYLDVDAKTLVATVGGIGAPYSWARFKSLFQCDALRFINDPGHGWLEVKRAMLYDLGLLDKISACSYQKDNNVYLEEDCDLSLFARTVMERFRIDKATFDASIVDVYQDPCPVRGYDSFKGGE